MGEERGAYLSVDVVETAEQVNLTLRALLGEYTNYGYLYALSSYASELLGWERFDVADPDGQVFLDTPPLLNLVYPCFNEIYASDEEITACKALAAKLLSRMDDPFAGGADYSGLFYSYGDEPYIELAYLYSLTHEYTHYPDWLSGTEDNSWCAEVLACYYGAEFSYLSRLAYARAEGGAYIGHLSSIIGRPYDG